MEIKIRKEGSRLHMNIIGKIDESGAEELKQCFYKIDRSDISEVIFDFKEVSYIGSACIGKLLLFYKEMGDTGGNIRIINASADVYEMIRLVKLETILNISK
ncbi:STAS domain-containing protein [Desulfococcaceae bacterium HSG8]|nr:STAS domain-containing protein [Desulfococcaceae bacterium HSG8]